MINKEKKYNDFKKNRTYNKIMRKMGNRKQADLKTENEQIYKIFIEKENNLIAAYESKILKSKALIKKAQDLITERNKKTKTKSNK